MRFVYVLRTNWPTLAWVATAEKNSSEIEVQHGTGVETNDDWFGEIVWDGDYNEANFDQTDIVAGSGCRLRGNTAVFVTSGSTVDRIVICDDLSGAHILSNSLPAAMKVADIELVPHYPDYIRDLTSIMAGLKGSQNKLECNRGSVELVYFDNLEWNGQSLKRLDKPNPKREFTDFAAYRSFLLSSLQRMNLNLRAEPRSFLYKLRSTVSSGYDSPTIAVLAHAVGCEEAYTFKQGRYGANDSGLAIGKQIGINTLEVDSNAWQNLPPKEYLFYGPSGCCGEIVYRGHENNLHGAVLLTGYHGDAIWGLRKKYESNDIVRGDSSGLALTEYRLHVGFIHCPIPFWGARQITEIQSIARLSDMAPWSLLNTDYNRPICRRIVEQAGVSRELFGASKQAVGLAEFKLSPALHSEYIRYLNEHRSEWRANRKRFPICNQRIDRLLDQAHRNVFKICIAAVQFKRRRAAGFQVSTSTSEQASPDIVKQHLKPKAMSRVNSIKRTLSEPRGLHRFVVPWALEKCKCHYEV